MFCEFGSAGVVSLPTEGLQGETVKGEELGEDVDGVQR